MKTQTPTITSLLCLALLSYAGAADAQDTVIRCPIDTIQTDVRTPLPDGWWSTPQGGKLSGTKIMNVGGRAALVCVYKLTSAEASIVREVPDGMDCRATGNVFRCKAAYRQGDGSKGTPTRIDGQARQDVPVRKDDGNVLTPGGFVDRSGPNVKKAGNCPDPALTGVEIQGLNRDAQGQYYFRLAATVANLGNADYRSGPGQQRVDIYRISGSGGSARLGSVDFQNVPAGSDSVTATYDVLRWRTSDEFLPTYRFNIVYGPDISSDGNTANDDCVRGNNSTTITGDEINAIIRGSGL